MSLEREDLRSLLRVAVENGQVEEVKQLVDRNGLPDGSEEYDLLNTALVNDRYDIAKFLVHAGAKACSENVAKNKLLHKVASFEVEDPEMFESLLSDDTPFDTYEEEFRNTPIHTAAAKGHEKIVAILLSRDASVSKTNERGDTPLHLSAKGGFSGVVDMLLEKGANPNAVNVFDKTSLHCASEEGKDEVVQMLLDNGANVNVFDRDLCTPLHLAQKSTILVLLLEHGANVNAISYQGRYTSGTPLHSAVQKGKDELVRILLNHGANVNTTGSNDNTPLHDAAQRNASMVAVLMENGANANIHNEYGSTPLHYAADSEDCEEIVRVLLKHNANAEARDFDGNLPLHWMAQRNQKNAVKLLLELGFDVNAVNDRRETPLHSAAEYGSEEVVELLVNHGGNICAVADYDRTPLHVAHNSRTAELLIKSGVPIELFDVNGSTPLHCAATNGWDDVACTLLNRGANVDAISKDGSTPLHYAALNKNDSVFTVLLNHGANIFAVNNHGSTPLHCAATHQTYTSLNSELVKLLLESGANVDSLDNDGNTPLICTAQSFEDCGCGQDHDAEERLKITHLLLSHNSNVSAVNLQGQTSLHFASRNGHCSIVELLLEHGAEVNVVDDSGRTPLHHALDHYANEQESSGPLSYGVVPMLLNHDADVRKTDKDGNTPLHLAAQNGIIGYAELLLKAGANVNGVNEEGNTPLHLAARYHTIGMVEVLLKNGAAVDVVNREEDTPITCATSCSVIEALLKWNANAHWRGGSNQTALHRALSQHSPDPDIVKLLLNIGIDASLEDNSGQTALKRATNALSQLNNDSDWERNRLNEIVMTLKKNVIQLSVAGWCVSETDRNSVYLNLCEELRGFKQYCEEEVERMNQVSLCGNVTLFSIFSKRRNPLYLRNELIAKRLSILDLDPFPIYQRFIANCLEESKTRIELITSGQMSLKCLLKISNVLTGNRCPILLDEILEKIVMYLNNIDLKALNLCREELLSKVS